MDCCIVVCKFEHMFHAYVVEWHLLWNNTRVIYLDFQFLSFTHTWTWVKNPPWMILMIKSLICAHVGLMPIILKDAKPKMQNMIEPGLGHYFSKGNQIVVWFVFHMYFANLFIQLWLCCLCLNFTLCKTFTSINICICVLLQISKIHILFWY